MRVGSVAELGRRERLLQVAEAILAHGGEERLQMKQLAERAGVAVATVYRYFPSKDHLLAGIAVERHRRNLERLAEGRFDGDGPGGRAAGLLIREFRSVQRNPEMATALQRIANAPQRSASEHVEEIHRLFERMVIAAVGQNGKQDVTAEQWAVLPIVVGTVNNAVTLWLVGSLSVEQARERLRIAARLFDLPADIVRRYLIPGAPH
jgi:TetR/AcrR family transcriptional regulator, cholesterol catabolism regulator